MQVTGLLEWLYELLAMRLRAADWTATKAVGVEQVVKLKLVGEAMKRARSEKARRDEKEEQEEKKRKKKSHTRFSMTLL
jgi:hypothetical protein